MTTSGGRGDDMGLREELQGLIQGWMEQAPPETVDVWMTYIKGLMEKDAAGAALKPGTQAQPFALPNAVGETVTLKLPSKSLGVCRIVVG